MSGEWVVNWGSIKALTGPDARVQAYVERSGQGPTVVMLHGMSDSSRSFAPLVPHLTSCRLIAPDLAGHGATGGDPGSFADLCSQVSWLIQNVSQEPVVLVGHSLGAMVATGVAASIPDHVGGLVTIAGSIRPKFGPDNPVAVGVRRLSDPISPDHEFFSYWHASTPPAPRHFLDMVAREAAAIPAHSWRTLLDIVNTVDLADIATQVRAPALVIGGALDPLFGPEHQMRLSSALGVEATILENCGHNPHWEQPLLVGQMVSEFLASLRLPQDHSSIPLIDQ